MGLVLTPLTLREAHAYVARVHRHHKPSRGGIFAIAVADLDEAGPYGYIRGVAVVGRPVARKLQDDWTAEVTRVATDGARNACSMLYAAAWRACKAVGYRRLVTYTLPEEGGASLRAAGWRCIGQAGGGNWNGRTRPRVDSEHQQLKLRWEAA